MSQSHEVTSLEHLLDVIAAQKKRIVFLEGVLRYTEEMVRHTAAKYAIIEARYKQVEERWHKLMQRKDLQAGNRL
jgi:hypothetical protein